MFPLFLIYCRGALETTQNHVVSCVPFLGRKLFTSSKCVAKICDLGLWRHSGHSYWGRTFRAMRVHNRYTSAGAVKLIKKCHAVSLRSRKLLMCVQRPTYYFDYYNWFMITTSCKSPHVIVVQQLNRALLQVGAKKHRSCSVFPQNTRMQWRRMTLTMVLQSTPGPNNTRWTGRQPKQLKWKETTGGGKY